MANFFKKMWNKLTGKKCDEKNTSETPTISIVEKEVVITEMATPVIERETAVEEIKEECVTEENITANNEATVETERHECHCESTDKHYNGQCTCSTKCESCKCEETHLDTSFLKNIDWDNLSMDDIDELNKIDLTNICDDLIDWYKISNMIALPDDFLRKNKDKIIWKEYNKRYLKKATKEMLKAEGYID